MLTELKNDLKKTCNKITFSRLLFIPLLLYFSYINSKWIFFLLYAIQWWFDALDGYFARKLKESSPNGAFYDGVVDEIDVFLSIVYLYFFYPDFVLANLIVIIPMFAFNTVNRTISSIFHGQKFRLHIYLGKYSVSIFHIFILYAVIFGANQFFFYLTILILVIFLVEEFFILVLFRDIGTDIGSILLLLKKKRR
ncbi:MAG: CDP-alcohol phosphatidyltransferase family protein [Nanoarchaeota archaeon]|nr:CDP-alcohol phosphatidyltransferase family protein [Nanoarchaeota archaeon]